VAKRLFLAVDIEPAVTDVLGRISSEVRRRIDPRIKMSWVKPERMHLTLHFFGTADAAAEQRLVSALHGTIPHTAFDLSFGGLGMFPERGSPRVLWVGIRAGADALRRLHAVVTQRIGLPSDDEYRPHLTLARYRERVRRSEIVQILTMPAAAGPSRIDRVTLYESRLSPKGPTYARLAEALLKP